MVLVKILRMAAVMGAVVCMPLPFAAFSVANGEEGSREAASNAMSPQVFLKQLQLLGRRHPPGGTKFEQDDRRAALRAKIKEQFAGQLLEYKVRIVDVDWRDGRATIRTATPTPRHRASRQNPFTISFLYSLSIPMSREQAAAIDIRKPLLFRGRMIYEDQKYGAIARPPISQMLFTVRSQYYSSITPICSFMTDDYAVYVGDEELFVKRRDSVE